MKIPLVDLKTNYQSIEQEIDLAIKNTIKSSNFINGPFLEKFERCFAHYIGVKYCIGVASGTDALYLSLLTLNIEKGDEVILPVNTFIATAYAVLYCGAKPVFVDIDEQTHTINVNLIKKAITKKTRAIIPVHLYGTPADMDQIRFIAQEYNLHIIEDACQAHGAVYGNKRVGSLGNLAAFSFYPSKNLGAYGDGGAITTNSSKLANSLLSIREYGTSSKYIFNKLGFNSRLDGLQAAILTVKLKYLDRWNKKKLNVAEYYNKQISSYLPFIKIPKTLVNTTTAYHLYVIRTPNRNQLAKFLARQGIQTGIHYPVPLHLQKSLTFLGYKKGDFPIAELVSNEILSLPIYPELTRLNQNYIIKTMQSFFIN